MTIQLRRKPGRRSSAVTRKSMKPITRAIMGKLPGLPFMIASIALDSAIQPILK